MNITVPDYILQAILIEQAPEKGNTKEKIYTTRKGHRILVYTYWNEDHLMYNMEWESGE